MFALYVEKVLSLGSCVLKASNLRVGAHPPAAALVGLCRHMLVEPELWPECSTKRIEEYSSPEDTRKGKAHGTQPATSTWRA